MTDTLLPLNATAPERALEAVGAVVADIPTPVRETWRADDCPAPLLPWLASAFSVDAWKPEWTDAQKRATIRESVSVHRRKGTIGAVQDALAALGFTAQVQEWFRQSPLGSPYTYRLLLEVTQVGVSQFDYASVVALVAATKNLRSHMDEIVPIVTTVTGPITAGVTGMGCEVTLTYKATDFYLLMEGANNGMTATEAAVDTLHTLVHTTLPSANYW